MFVFRVKLLPSLKSALPFPARRPSSNTEDSPQATEGSSEQGRRSVQSSPNPVLSYNQTLYLNFTLTPRRVNNVANDVWLSNFQYFIKANLAKALNVRCACLLSNSCLIVYPRPATCTIQGFAGCTSIYRTTALTFMSIHQCGIISRAIEDVRLLTLSQTTIQSVTLAKPQLLRETNTAPAVFQVRAAQSMHALFGLALLPHVCCQMPLFTTWVTFSCPHSQVEATVEYQPVNSAMSASMIVVCGKED